MTSLNSGYSAQRLLSLTGGVTLCIALIYMIQILSAVQTSRTDDRPMLVLNLLVLNLLELPQTQITDKTVSKQTVSKPLKQKIKKAEPVKQKAQPKKTTEAEPIKKPSVPDLNSLSTPQPVENSKTSGETSRLPTPVPYFKLSDLPRFMHRETPLYPENMRASGQTGTVELEVLIDKTGTVRLITVTRSAGESFDQAAINAIKTSSFAPAKVAGKPVSAILKIPVRFKLQ